MISNAERQYMSLVQEIKETGTFKSPTKGRTLSVFHRTITILPDEVPLLQGRRIYWKGIVGELKAFMSNEDTVKGFEKHGCNFWGAWANEDGSLDVDYARLLHNFNGVNQLSRLIGSLSLTPHSRKHVISLWDPSSKALQVPCVLSYQWYVEGATLHMIWNQRSVDVMIGLASDMFSAWLLNKLVAKAVGLKAGVVYMDLGDCHIYEEHLRLVKRYIDNVWDDVEMKKPRYHLDFDSIYDFNLIVSDYNPIETMKFELKI